jgi:predicted DsbA family dithiol-disulfide isomerase
MSLRIDVWSDVVCPWCYIGEHRLGLALARSPHGADVEIVWRPFQLDPRAPVEPQPVADAYARKFGGADAARTVIERISAAARADGLPIRLDRAQRANTFDAHRLMTWALPTGRQGALGAALFRAYFVDGANVADRTVLAACAADVGLDGDAAAEMLATDAHVDDVRAQLEEARDLGISAVPSFAFPGGFVLPGAQDPAVFERILAKLATRAAS